MTNENNELIMELWDRIRSHIAPKERLEVADIMVVVFDEFGLADDLAEEDLDKELRAAVRSHFGEAEADEEEDDGYDEL